MTDRETFFVTDGGSRLTFQIFSFLSISGLDISITNKDIAILPRYILSTDLLGAGFSSHWAPYWRSCTPCHFSYDIIMKVLIHSIDIIDQLLSTILGSKNLLFFRSLIDLALIIFFQLETGSDDLAYLWQKTGLDSQAGFQFSFSTVSSFPVLLNNLTRHLYHGRTEAVELPRARVLNSKSFSLACPG